MKKNSINTQEYYNINKNYNQKKNTKIENKKHKNEINNCINEENGI